MRSITNLLAIIYGILVLPSISVHASCEEIAKFHLYERGQSEKSDLCNLTCSPLKSTMIIIHGFNTDQSSYIWGVKRTVFDHFKHVENIIDVDWQRASQRCILGYGDVVGGTIPKVYNRVLKLLEILHNRGCRNIGMIGHSLGAHISGNAARIYEASYNTSINLIIGLDPAGPGYDKEYSISVGITTRFRRDIGGYYSLNKDGAIYGYLQFTHSNNYLYNGLTKDNANHVIVFHTDTVCLGIDENIGEIDVYINDGYGQPGCCLFFCPPKFLGCIMASGCSHRYGIQHFSRHEIVGRILQAYPELGLEQVPA